MNRSTKVSLSVVAAATLLIAGTTTGAVAGKLITGRQIAKDTITSRNLAPKSVGRSELQPALRAALERAGLPGATGPQGPVGAAGRDGANGPAGTKGDQGEQGDQGEKGEQGDSGITEVTEIRTSDSDSGALAVSGYWLVPVESNGSLTGGDTETPVLTFELDAGRYVVDTTVQFFGGSNGAQEYGVVTLDLDGDNLPGTVFTGDLPGISNLAEQTGGRQVITVEHDDTQVQVLASVRSSDEGAYAGAQAVVTQVG